MASPGGKGDSGRFDFDAWCRTNRIHDRIVDFLRFQELMTPRLLSRLTDEEKVMLSEEEGVQQRDIARLEAAIDQLFHEGHRKSSAGFSPTHLFALDKLRTYSESSEAQREIVKTKATTLQDKQHNGRSEHRGPSASAFDRDVVRKTFPPSDNRNRYSLRPETLSKTKGTGSPIVSNEKSARAKGTVTSNGEGRVERMRALFSSSTENTVSSRLKTFEELKTSPTKTPARVEDLNKPDKGRSFVPLRDHVSKRFPYLTDESTKRHSMPLEKTFQQTATENEKADNPHAPVEESGHPTSFRPSRLGYKSESDILNPESSIMTSAIPEEGQSPVDKNVSSDWLYDVPKPMKDRADSFKRSDIFRRPLRPTPSLPSSGKEDFLKMSSKQVAEIDEEMDHPTLEPDDMTLSKELETEWFQRAHLLRNTSPMPAATVRRRVEPHGLSLVSKPFDHWSPSEVRQYFEADPQEDIRRHASLFEENSVSGWDLVSKDDIDSFLKNELKIANAGHRRKIQRRISTLQRREALRPGAVPSPVAEPKNLTIVYNDGRKVTATWKPPRHKIDAYMVTITELYEPYTELVMKRLSHYEDTSITCEGLQPRTHYVIRVVALCGDEESEPLSQPFRTSEELHGDSSPRTVKRSASINNQSHYMTPAPLYHVYQTERIPILVKSDTQGPPTLTWMSSSTPTWDKFPQVIQSGIKYRLTPTQRQLQEAMFEVLSSEESFIKSMYVLGEHFLRNLEKKNVAGGQALTLISVHVAHVINASRAFLSDLQARVREQAPVVSDVCDIILRHASKRFQEPYVTYCRNMHYHSKALIGLMQADKSFCDDVRQLETDPQCGNLPMTAFLLTPMQRVTRFPLLVDRILTFRDVNSELFLTAEQALQTTKALAVKCNQAAYKEQQAMELEELVVNKLRLAKCKPPFSLLDKSRWIVKQGELILVRDKGPNTHRYVILLSDCLLIAKKLHKRGSEVTYELVNYCMRNRLDVEEVNKIYDDSERASSSDGGKGRLSSFLQSLYFFKPKPTSKLRVTLHEDSSGQHQEMVFSLKTESELTRWVEALQYSAADPQGGKIYPDWDCPMTVVTKSRNAAQPDELSLEKGDIVRVLRKMHDGMWHGETIHDGRQGWFPHICVEEVKDSDHYKAKQLRQKHGSSPEKDVKEYTYVTLFDLEPEFPTALRLQKDQKVEILDFRDGEWYQARLLDTLEVGLVPADYVAPMDDLLREEWYLGSMDRKDADALLRACGIGTYLVRETHNTKGPHVYTISVKNKDKEGREVIRRFKVERTKHNKLRVSKEQEFDTLQELMKDLIEKGSIAGCPLDQPCPKPKPQIKDFKGRWEVSRERIKLGKKLGQGQFGDVVEGFWNGTGDSDDSPVKVAVKTTKAGSTVSAFLQEAEMMMRLYHPNLVQLYGVCSEKDPVLIITEFMANGSLEKYLRHGQGSGFTLMELVNIAVQVSDGMAYLEENAIVHRDLRAANVLVGEDSVCKVADFGLARIDHYKASSAQFPIRWTAIESIQTHEFTVQSDVWSFGILMAEILSKGKVPYMGWDNTQVLQRVVQGYRLPRESSWPESLYQLMRQCWDKEPAKRPSFSTLRDTLRDFLLNTRE
ncbi:PREDICTED: uncharacterized protein LOC109469896 [Branchiostoma belcheri]|uniref:Uncharacterized protein LOC109469896 n=1 Tax=Branchiostoma belcheri TaxID=7741 RepID=A0A6P4Z3R5_BRABE|nr:PREDICTED: uncharacterized protein LOC109469896 [Branchiostoma belcheri]